MACDRGIAARGLSSLFYAFRNTINIYTEDEDKDKKFYKKLFKRLLEGTGVVINDIHPLGNCEEVIKHCKDDTDNSMPKIYIIDGDIYLMTAEREPVKHLYVLDSYCMENKVIDEDAYYKVFSSLDPYHEEDEIRDKADYNTMMSAAEEPFMRLYCHFAVCRDFVKHFHLQSAKEVMDSGSISETKVVKKCKEIDDAIVTYSGKNLSDVQTAINDKIAHFPANRTNLMKYVSGKDYLFVYIDAYTQARLKAMPGQKKEFWKYQFLNHCNLTQLQGLKNAIISEVREFNELNQVV